MTKDSMSIKPSNAFNARFLEMLRTMEDSGTPAEVDLAGPWKVTEVADGWGLFRVWESPDEGHEPLVVCDGHARALRLLAVLEACGREPLYVLGEERGPQGYELRSAGETVGRMRRFDPALALLFHGAECLGRSPVALAALLRGSGPQAMQLVGEIVYREVAAGTEGVNT
jgi:hypothetical protein